MAQKAGLSLYRYTFTLFLSAVILGFAFPDIGSANKTMDKLNDIQGKLKNKIEQVKKARKKEESLKTRMDRIDRSIKEKEKELKQYDRRMSKTKNEINKYSRELKGLTETFSGRREYLKQLIRTFYKRQYGGNALVLISANDYQDLIRKSKYVSLVAHYDSLVVSKYSNEIKRINDKKSKLRGLQSKINESKINARKRQKALELDKNKKNKLLTLVKSKRAAHEKNIKELEVSSKKLQDMVRKLEAKAIPKAILGKGFRAHKGKLPWPVNGKVVIPYGNYQDPLYKIPVFKKGIEIAVQPGEVLRSIAGGRVVFADHFKGYGMLMIIDHGSGYHSVYRNISEALLSKGDLLIKGTEIGKVQDDVSQDNLTVYFEIRHKGKPVNPMYWLARKS